MGTKEKDLRAAIVAQCRAMSAAGLEPRHGRQHFGAPRRGDADHPQRSVPYDLLRPEMMALMPLNGEYGAWSGPLKPSTEWRFHLDIMRARPDVGAIVHSHPPYCTALATLNRPILAAHYMIAQFGGPIDRVHALRAVRHQGTVRARGRGPRRAACGAARQPRRDRRRRRPRRRDASRARTRGAGAHLLSRDQRRPAGDPLRRGDRPHRRALQGLRRRRRDAQGARAAEETRAAAARPRRRRPSAAARRKPARKKPRGARR